MDRDKIIEGISQFAPQEPMPEKPKEPTVAPADIDQDEQRKLLDKVMSRPVEGKKNDAGKDGYMKTNMNDESVSPQDEHRFQQAAPVNDPRMGM